MFIRDIVSDRTQLMNNANGSLRKLEMNMIHHKEVLNSEWTRQVCDYANIDYGFFRRRLIDVIDGKSDIKIKHWV